MRRWAVVVLVLVLTGACKGSPNTRPKVHARVTTTTASTTTSLPTTTTTFASSTTTAVALARPCASTDLDVGFGPGGGAGGTFVNRVLLRNVSANTCSLSGHPTFVTGQTDTGAALQATFGNTVVQPHAGNLTPGASGVVTLETGSACDGEGDLSTQRRYKQLRIGLPGGGSVFLGDFAIDGTCFVHVSDLGLEDSRA